MLCTAADFAEFQPRAPWWGADLQTLRNVMARKPAPLPGERLHLAMADGSGDRLAATPHRPEMALPDAPLVVLMHGLSGTEDSSYMIHTARQLRRDGINVLRVSLRGAGPSRQSCQQQYHAGRSADLRDLVLALPVEFQRLGIVMVGFSLSGNMSLKFAAEFASDLPVRGVVAISAPIDLALTSANMLRPRNWIYNQKLLWDYKRQCTDAGAAVGEAEREAIFNSRNFVDFDNWFVAPRNGFADAEDYWRQSMAKQFLPDIALPTLIIHALNDPLVPSAPYLDVNWAANPHLIPLLPAKGGHVGFHGVGGVWYHDCLRRFVVGLRAIT